MFVAHDEEIVLPPFPPPPLETLASRTAVFGTSSRTSPSAVAIIGSASTKRPSTAARKSVRRYADRLIDTSFERNLMRVASLSPRPAGSPRSPRPHGGGDSYL